MKKKILFEADDLFGGDVSTQPGDTLGGGGDLFSGSDIGASGGDLFSSPDTGLGGGGGLGTTQQQPLLDLNDVGKIIVLTEISDILESYMYVLQKLIDISPVFMDLYERVEQIQTYLYYIIQNFQAYRDRLNVIMSYYMMYLIESSKIFIAEVIRNSSLINISKKDIRKFINKLDFLRKKTQKQIKKDKKEEKEKEKEKQQNNQSQNNNQQNNSQQGNNQQNNNSQDNTDNLFGGSDNTEQNKKSENKENEENKESNEQEKSNNKQEKTSNTQKQQKTTQQNTKSSSNREVITKGKKKVDLF